MSKRRKSGSLMHQHPKGHALIKSIVGPERRDFHGGFYCEFCHTRQSPYAAGLWVCPFGCDYAHSRCRACAQLPLNKKRQEILLGWVIQHVDGCTTIEASKIKEAPESIFADFSRRSLAVFAASLATQIQRLTILRHVVEGRRVPGIKLLKQVEKLNIARTDADRVVLTAIWTVLFTTFEDWPQWLQAYHSDPPNVLAAKCAWATKYYALRCGLSPVLIAELEVRAQMRTQYVQDDVIDAATAAWVAGDQKFARDLLQRESKNR